MESSSKPLLTVSKTFKLIIAIIFSVCFSVTLLTVLFDFYEKRWGGAGMDPFFFIFPFGTAGIILFLSSLLLQKFGWEHLAKSFKYEGLFFIFLGLVAIALFLIFLLLLIVLP